LFLFKQKLFILGYFPLLKMKNELFDMVEGYDAISRSIKMINKAGEIIGLDDEHILEIIQPHDIQIYKLHTQFSGKPLNIWGCTSLHNKSRGLYKGGIRISPHVDVFDVVELSRLMTIKTACVDLEFGGAKSGIRFDMKEAYKKFGINKYDPDFETDIKRGILHEFSHHFKNILMKHEYVPAPDIGTNSIDMASIFNETEDPSTVTGKPEGLPGWLPGRNESTGYGVSKCVVDMLNDLSIPLKGAKVAIQGFGNVGSNTAKFLSELGVKVVAVADVDAILHDPNGFDIDKLMEHTKNKGTIKGFLGKEISNEEFFSSDVDVLIPAAIGNVITGDNAGSIKARGIVEAANMPIHHKAEKILEEKGIRVIPDIIANAGGVIASSEEYSKSLSAKYMKKEETYAMIDHRIMSNLRLAKEIAKKHDVNLNLACYILALKRISNAHNIRGWV